MDQEFDGVEQLRRARFFREYRVRARDYVADPDRLRDLASRALAKLKRTKSDPIRRLADQVTIVIRLIRAYAKGRYREVSKANLILLVASVVYFVTPVDLIPDVIAGVGFLDDAAVLALILRALGDELERFAEWEDLQARDS